MSPIPKPYLKTIIVLALLLVAAGLIMACTSEPTPLPVAPTNQVEENVEVAIVPPPTPTEAPTATPTVAALPADNGCVDCHTDQQQLIDTGEEEVVLETLSEGEG